MQKSKEKHISDMLLDEMVEKGILRVNHNRAEAQSLVRSYFILVHREAVKNTNCARNKTHYTEPNFED